MTPTNPSKRRQPVSESSTKPDPSPPQKRVKLAPDSPSKSDPAVIRLRRAGFLDSLSRPVTRPPEQSMQDDKKVSGSSGSHLGGRQGTPQWRCCESGPTSGHFTWTILHSSGVRGGNGEAEAEAGDAMLERGKRGFGAAGALTDLHAQLAAHNLVMGQVKELAIRRRNWAHLMGKVGKGKGAG